MCECFSNSKEKYVFIIRTFDKIISKEKSFVLKAKSTIDMNGWIFSINSHAFMCTENKRIFDLAVDLNKCEKKFVEFQQEKCIKAFANLEEFLENSRVRTWINANLKKKELMQGNFKVLLDLLELYFRSKLKNSKENDEEAYFCKETLYKTLEKAAYNVKNAISEGKKENFTIKNQDLPREIIEFLDLSSLFQKKFESFEDKSFWEAFEMSIKQKIIDFLKKTQGIKKVLIEALGNFKGNCDGFQKPMICDLKDKKIKENSYLNLPRKGAKKESYADFSGRNSSLKNSEFREF